MVRRKVGCIRIPAARWHVRGSISAKAIGLLGKFLSSFQVDLTEETTSTSRIWKNAQALFFKEARQRIYNMKHRRRESSLRLFSQPVKPWVLFVYAAQLPTNAYHTSRVLLVKKKRLCKQKHQNKPTFFK